MVYEDGAPESGNQDDLTLAQKVAGVTLGISTVGITAATAAKIYMSNLEHQNALAIERASRREAQRSQGNSSRQRQAHSETNNQEQHHSSSDDDLPVVRKRGI